MNWVFIFILLVLTEKSVCFWRTFSRFTKTQSVNTNLYYKKYHFSQRYSEDLVNRIRNRTNDANEVYGFRYYESRLKRLNSKNATVQNMEILNELNEIYNNTVPEPPKLRFILNNTPDFFKGLGIYIEKRPNTEDEFSHEENMEGESENGKTHFPKYRNVEPRVPSKSQNFEVLKNPTMTFRNVGGYENIKDELRQCVDILKHYQKYMEYNVRLPRGLILEGLPGTGKTLLAKALAGEADCSFIPVSGSDFQEKYVGVGPMRIKELFGLARENVPCIIFIDEVDALGRKRSTDGESSSNERDNTLNALLVELDGFKNTTGIFVVAATNRFDLLDNALTRPGRIDKRIFIGLPDKITRECILNIHIKGKPHDESVKIENLVDITDGLSGAQIENLLNEAMLYALRHNKTVFCNKDIDFIMNKIISGWQPTDHEFTSDIIDHIAIHEMGHAIVGLFCRHHSKMSKVVINLSSPKTPGYTIFESSTSNIYVREALFEHLMILLSGRIAEELFYNVSVTTGALNDLEEALKLAQKMVVYYGMGSTIIYPNNSEKYREMIDNDVIDLIDSAYDYAESCIMMCKDLIYETAEILKQEKVLKSEDIYKLICSKYTNLLDYSMTE
jgi:cell division protease FtsH